MILSGMILSGQIVRLEPLALSHAEGLAAASAADPSLYHWTPVPQGVAEMTRYIQTALDLRDASTAVPFAVVRLADNTVIGCTRFWNIERWEWPAYNARHGNPHPDVAEIGWTWYTASAIRTGANPEAKFLMLQHAFEQWNVLRISLHTDSRNLRSQAAMERIGFQREGIIRAHKIASDGIARDSFRYSMIAAEWPAAKQRLLQRLQQA
jgi:RimJ/RimL family protein N-acetyltransferase